MAAPRRLGRQAKGEIPRPSIYGGSTRAAGIDYDNAALDKWHERIGCMRRWIRRFARWFAAGVTIAIMASLFLFDPDTEVSDVGLWLIALSPLAQPMLMATMVIVDALCFWSFVAVPAWWFTRKALRAIRTTRQMQLRPRRRQRRRWISAVELACRRCRWGTDSRVE